MTVRLVELFSGIGAQRLALMQAGIDHEVVGISEIDRYALASYEAIYGDCPNLGDVTKIPALPDCDLVTYSFPCQDLSLAGKREGMAEGSGTRSALVWEVTRVLEATERKPEWLLMENVPQLLSKKNFPEFQKLVDRLARMGYHNKWAKLDSSNFGSAQKRIRAYMVSRYGQDPPDIPVCVPNAPKLCLRDVMEPTRDERFVRHVPLDSVKWRESKAAGLSAEERLVAEHFARSRGPGDRVYHEDMPFVDGSTRQRNGCWSVMDESGHIRFYMGDRVKSGISEMQYYSVSDRAPTLTTVRPPKVLEAEDNGIHALGCIDREGNVDMGMRHRQVPSRKRRIYNENGLSPTVLKSDSPTKVGRLEASYACVPDESEDEPVDRTELVRQDRHGAASVHGGELVISILTPRECWRLMGFPDWAFFRASKVSSETQLYNQAGNSIVVEVLIALFNAMFRPLAVTAQAAPEVSA